MKTPAAAAPSSSSSKRRWRGPAVAVLALVVCSLLVPLAFLFGRFPAGAFSIGSPLRLDLDAFLSVLMVLLSVEIGSLLVSVDLDWGISRNHVVCFAGLGDAAYIYVILLYYYLFE